MRQVNLLTVLLLARVWGGRRSLKGAEEGDGAPVDLTVRRLLSPPATRELECDDILEIMHVFKHFLCG